MKAPFKVGQDVVCINDTGWCSWKIIPLKWWQFWKKNDQTRPGPKINELCEVRSIRYVEGYWVLGLLGWENLGLFMAHCFRATDSQSISLKEQAKEVIKETQVLITDN